MSYSFSHSYPWFTVASIIFQFWQPPPISPSLFLFIWNQICLSWSFKVKKLDVKVIYLLQQRYEYFRLPPPPFFFNPLLFSLPLPVTHPIPLLEVARSWAVYNSLFQIFEVAPSLYMVEVRKSGGDTLEFHKVYYNNVIALCGIY